ncbi:MAG: DUF4358 domain-containing protein [Clostridia bacterium]|nr:DUF4358 domain-containing protein [Clostridia bacterium]
MALSLFSCGREETNAAEKNVDALADALISKLEFDIIPEEIDGEVALSDYEIDEALVSEVRYFRVGSAVADEIAIFKVNNKNDIPTIENAVSERIKYLKAGFSDYKPSEVPKIENAYTKTIGNIVILCICKNTAQAELIISEA